MTQGGANPKGIAIRPLRSGDEPAYRRFCDERFGPDGYQGRSNYLQWLYIDNPAGRGFADCLLATEPSGAIVACIHRMRLPWQINAGRVDIPSLHNLVAEPSRGGAGFFVLMAAVRGETHAFIPGVVGDLAQAYARMRYQRVETRWYRRVLRPDRAAWQVLAHRLGRPAPRRRLPAHLGVTVDGLAVTTLPDDDLPVSIASALNVQATSIGPEVAHVDWTAALIKWRFFSPRGPRHVLVTDPADGSFAILSLGPRNGVTVARMLTWSPAAVGASFLTRLEHVASRLGAAVMLAYDARPGGAQTLSAVGWRPMRSPPLTFLYVRDKRSVPVVLDGGATDLGFEALPDTGATDDESGGFLGRT